MPNRQTIRDEAERLSAVFVAAGAEPREMDMLQPAERLLDLYGEDIRARAYVTSDPLRGEMMLRPDFTVPLVLDHFARNSAKPARYTYAGPVFRRQEHDVQRPSEYLQVGYEVMGATDAAMADAEVFATLWKAMGTAPVRAVIGDIGLLRAAVNGLETTERRKSALLRHLWRPKRFRALLDRFGGRLAPSASRAALLGNVRGADVETLIADAAPAVGKRTAREIAARVNWLREDADTPPLRAQDLDYMDALLSLCETPAQALKQLRDIAIELPAIANAVDRLEDRFVAMEAARIALDTLQFEASYGRATLEYYDGFVFGFHALNRADLPPVASGGRYDALTAVLGEPMPAVGGVVRPDVLILLNEAAA